MSNDNEKKSASKAPGRPVRWSARRKAEIATRLMRGESLDELSRETGKAAHELAAWRDTAVAAMEAALKASGTTGDVAAADEKRRLQAKLGEVTMDNELLREKIARLESGRPFGKRRRSKR